MSKRPVRCQDGNSVKIIGSNLATVERLAQQVKHEMEQVKGIEDLGIFRVLGQSNLNVTVGRREAARYGLNTGDVNAVVQAALGGTTAMTILEADRQFALEVRPAPEYRGNLDAVCHIKVGFSTANGNAYIPFNELTNIILDTDASFKFSVRGRDLGGTVAEAQERIAKSVQLPSGYRIICAGEFENLERAQKRLEVIVQSGWH
jgi:cobalt-zinc-cadmium resistance protein CzcA